MPTTSIYSRTDGVVAWQCSVQDPRSSAHGEVENLEVVASHLGLGMNPAAMYAIADRLAQPEGRWRPFHRNGWRSMVYPEPYGEASDASATVASATLMRRARSARRKAV